MLLNREDEIRQLNSVLDLAKSGIAPKILMTGYRGVGKTSLLKEILKSQPENVLTVHIDLSNIRTARPKAEDVLEELCRNLVKKINMNDEIYLKIKYGLGNYIQSHYNADVFNLESETIRKNYPMFARFILELAGNIVSGCERYDSAVIAFDEIELFGGMDDAEQFISMIAKSAANQPEVAYIFCVSLANSCKLTDMINEAFKSRMLELILKPFTKKQTEDYLEKCMPDVNLTDEGFEMLYTLTRGIPAYVNDISKTLPKDRKCDENTVKKAMTSDIGPWKDIWKGLSKTEKQILTSIAKNKKPTVHRLYDELDLQKREIQQKLDFFENTGLLVRVNAGYIIPDSMLEMFIRCELKKYI